MEETDEPTVETVTGADGRSYQWFRNCVITTGGGIAVALTAGRQQWSQPYSPEEVVAVHG